MTSPSDREVFLNEVREAIETAIAESMGAAGYIGSGADGHIDFIDGPIDTHDLAQAATDAMVRHLGPEF
ncbi:hypothetical protein A5668_09110 [Mycolicibacterium fortuitum]|uniref:hypothetical protein n=1 Tax=Mycolicibacterium fortuitum TaxID=1766 RepID=UPI0007EC0AFE|nr:hypothetical protein [Mycolicibacterium fortuitum]OBA94651.1 hypothetical protein A5668_09110 [Mycolicibacterium fortuitum]